jgi:formyltetrahydrofolate deformylase
MQVVITAVGPDHKGLAEPIIHCVTGEGANIAEIQMYDHDEERVFAMLCRAELDADRYDSVRKEITDIGADKGLSVRIWSPELRSKKPRLAICVTYRPEPPLALLRAVRDGEVRGEAALMIGNRPNCRSIAEQFGIDWHSVGDDSGAADDDRLISLCDEYEIDYIVLARYMRILPASSCWKYAGGRIINLHHGLLPSFKGIRPYHDAYAARMLTFGATCHFIVPELDAGNQIIQQSTFNVPPGTPLNEIMRIGQQDNEPRCLVEGVKRVVNREVQLHFHRIIARK